MFPSYFGSYALHYACGNCNTISDEVIVYLLSKAPGAALLQNRVGSTPLMLGCRHSASVRVCEALIRKMYPTKRCLKRMLPLSMDLINVILSFAPNPIETVDDDNRNVLYWCAAKNTDVNIVRLILEHTKVVRSKRGSQKT